MEVSLDSDDPGVKALPDGETVSWSPLVSVEPSSLAGKNIWLGVKDAAGNATGSFKNLGVLIDDLEFSTDAEPDEPIDLDKIINSFTKPKTLTIETEEFEIDQEAYNTLLGANFNKQEWEQQIYDIKTYASYTGKTLSAGAAEQMAIMQQAMTDGAITQHLTEHPDIEVIVQKEAEMFKTSVKIYAKFPPSAIGGLDGEIVCTMYTFSDELLYHAKNVKNHIIGALEDQVWQIRKHRPKTSDNTLKWIHHKVCEILIPHVDDKPLELHSGGYKSPKGVSASAGTHSSSGLGPFSLGKSKDSADSFVSLSDKLPGIKSRVVHPELKHFEKCKKDWEGKNYLSSVIMHMNDHHRWSRERIADWIDDLHDRGIIDAEFHIEVEEDK